MLQVFWRPARGCLRWSNQAGSSRAFAGAAVAGQGGRYAAIQWLLLRFAEVCTSHGFEHVPPECS
jgi:hypothetical protein